jgi:hypothetical protein
MKDTLLKLSNWQQAEKQDIRSNDLGIGVSYQFFIGRTFTFSPGFIVISGRSKAQRLRTAKPILFQRLNLTPIVRIGARLWKKY